MELSHLLDVSTLRPGAPRRLHLLVGLETWPSEGGPVRRPIHLALAVDRSGSMEGEKLRATRDAGRRLVEALSPGDLFALVAFDDAAEILVAPTRVADPARFAARIEGLEAGGTTNLSGGWLRALGLLADHREAGSIDRVLLLSDGQANRGVTDRGELARIATSHREGGIATSTLGFGRDFDEDCLSAVAESGGGRFHFIDSPERAAGAFLEEFGDVARIYGQNAELRFTPADGRIRVRALGRLPQRLADGATVVDLGDMRERDLKRCLFAIDLPPGWVAPGERDLGVLTVRYDRLGDQPGPRRHVRTVAVRSDPAAPAEPEPDPEVAREVVLFQLERLRGRALELLRKSDRDGARRILSRARALLEARATLDPSGFELERRDVCSLVEEAERCVRSGNDSRLKKSISSSSSMYLTQTGTSSSPSSKDILVFALTPATPDLVAEADRALRGGMEARGYSEAAIEDLSYALRELVANALEHGCRDLPSAVVDIELRLGRSWSQVRVLDPGPGFDLSSVLAHPSDRGVPAVAARVDRLEAGPAAGEMTASLRRDRAEAALRTEIVLDSYGVGEVAVLAFSGPLDELSAPQFVRLAQSIDPHRPLVIDLGRCSYISSAGIGAVIRAWIRANDAGARIVVVASPRVRISLVLALGRDRVAVEESFQAALRRLERP